MSTRAETVVAKAPKFIEWLTARGAQIIEPTNEWEVVRFRSGDVTSIVYRNARGRTRMTGDAPVAWEAFINGTSWRAIPATSRRKSMTSMIRTIIRRDGYLCFFCQRLVDVESASAEHLVPVTHGGPNHISNLVLAHQLCNQRAGHLSAAEKIRIHVAAVLNRQKESASV